MPFLSNYPSNLWNNPYILQPTHFGRVYAAYGGVFIVFLWEWKVDRIVPDRFDIIGGMP